MGVFINTCEFGNMGMFNGGFTCLVIFNAAGGALLQQN